MKSLAVVALSFSLLAALTLCCPGGSQPAPPATPEPTPPPPPPETPEAPPPPVATPKEEPIAPPPAQAPTEQPAIPYRSPTPTPISPTPIPYDVADKAYFHCGVEALFKLVELTEEIEEASLTDGMMCPGLQGWQDVSEGIREQHGNCRVPKSSHLLAARDWLESALDKTAESLLYLSEYCRSPGGGEEHSDAYQNLVLEAQFHMSESWTAFGAFIGRELEPSDAEQATPGYAKYTSAVLGFSAEYPGGWDVEGDNDATSRPSWFVFFHPPGPQWGKQSGIRVGVHMRAEAGEPPPPELPTDEEYIGWMNDFVEWAEFEIVVEPSIIEVDGYKAVEVVTSGTAELEGYVIWAAFIVVEDRTFDVMAGGHADEQNDYRSIYEHFITTFDVLPTP